MKKEAKNLEKTKKESWEDLEGEKGGEKWYSHIIILKMKRNLNIISPGLLRWLSEQSACHASVTTCGQSLSTHKCQASLVAGLQAQRSGQEAARTHWVVRLDKSVRAGFKQKTCLNIEWGKK